MTTTSSPTPVWTGRAVLGEGPVWSPRLGLVLFVDIRGARLVAWRPADGAAREWPMAEAPCWLVERTDGDGFLAGLRSRLVDLAFDFETGPRIRRDVARLDAGEEGNRFNDAKGDGTGRVFFGSMDDAETAPTGALHRIDPDERVARVDARYVVANGPAVSPDGRTLFHTDSAARSIYAFDLAADGGLSSKRLHIRFAEDDGYPDGMTCDADGGLWVGHWDGGRLTRFRPDGTAERTIPLPCSRVTSCCFFGTGLDRLAITTAAHERGHEPLAGSLFVVEPGVRGLPPATYGTP